MFFKLLFLEGQKRKKLFAEFPSKTVYVSSSRITCAKNSDFSAYNSSAIAYAWFIWKKGYKGDTTIRWINLQQATKQQKKGERLTYGDCGIYKISIKYENIRHIVHSFYIIYINNI